MPTLEWQLVTRISVVLRMSSVTTAAALSKDGLEERQGQSVVSSLVSGVSPHTILWTAIFVCWTQQKSRNGKNAPPIEYPDIPLSIARTPHNSNDLPVPQPPLRDQPFPAEEASNDDSEKEQGAAPAGCRPHRVAGVRRLYPSSHEDINDLVREMALTKSGVELLISRLK